MKNPLFIGVIYILVEIAGLILVGKAIGVFPTLLLIVLTSALGVYLVKRNGTNAFRNIQQSVKEGQAPGIAVIEAFIQFIGAILLIVPGFISNVIGLLMQTNATRNLFKPFIFYWLRKKMKGGNVIIYQK